MLQPIIPERPQKKSSEKSLDLENPSLSQEGEYDLTTPKIPKRPTKSGASNFAKEASPVIPPRPRKGSDHFSASDLKLNDGGGEDPKMEEEPSDSKQEVTHVVSTSDNQKDDDISSPVNDDGDDGDDENEEGDGDKTPGNSKTKITFKDDLSDENLNSSELSSFNDDQVTVLQERDQEQEQQHERDQDTEQEKQSDKELVNEQVPDQNQKQEQVQEEQTKKQENKEEQEEQEEVAEELRDQDDKQEKLTDLQMGSASKLDSIQPQEDIIEQNNPSAEDKESHSATLSKTPQPTMPIIPQRPQMGSRQKSSVEPESLSAKETDGDGDGYSTPLVPKRPLKKEDLKIESKEQAEEPIKDTERKESTPSVSSLQKLSVPSRPSIPNRPSKAPDSDKAEKANKLDKPEKLKAPPPKPKKLSSKIAAFQEMISKPQEPEPESSTSKRSNSNALLTDSLADDKIETSSTQVSSQPQRNKLSSNHMKFAQNLQGMMGRGFALPGMVDTSKLAHYDNEKETEENADGEAIKTGSESTEVSRKDPVRRAKGPKGKKLPKNLSSPVNIVTAPKFQTVQHHLWDFQFQKTKNTEDDQSENNKTTQQHIEDVTGTKSFLNAESDTKVINDFEEEEEIIEEAIREDSARNKGNETRGTEGTTSHDLDDKSSGEKSIEDAYVPVDGSETDNKVGTPPEKSSLDESGTNEIKGEENEEEYKESEA